MRTLAFLTLMSLLACKAKLGVLSAGTTNTDSHNEPAPGTRELNFTAPPSGQVGEQITVTWSKVDGATHYSLIAAKDDACLVPIIQIDLLTEPQQTLTFRQVGTYYFCVIPRSEDGQSFDPIRTGEFISVVEPQKKTDHGTNGGDHDPSGGDPTPSPPPPANVAPTLSIASPNGSNLSLALADALTISWLAADPDDDAKIDLFYTIGAGDPCTAGRVAIASGLSEDSVTDSYSWDTSGLNAGIYRVCAEIGDAVNGKVQAASDPVLIYPNGICTWSGFQSSDWGASGNWLGCGGATPGVGSSVLLLADTSVMPTLASSLTIDSFAASVGAGGVLTIASGVTLSITNSTASFASSIKFVGDSPTCTNCIVSGGNLAIVNDAALTLGSGITLSVGHSNTLKVGDGVSAGRLIAMADDPLDAATWPVMTSAGQWFGVIVTGTASTKSEISLDGVTMANITFYDLGMPLEFIDYFTIAKLDHVRLGRYGGYSAGTAAIELVSCAHAEIADTTWTALDFPDEGVYGWVGSYSRNVQLAADCTTPITMASPRGKYWGEKFENDPNGVLAWPTTTAQTCIWNGTIDDDWSNAANWTSCAARTGVPDQFDAVVIPSGTPNDPLLQGAAFIDSIGAGAPGGGTLTIAASSSLGLWSLATINSDITIKGATSTCSTCQVFGYPGSFTVGNNATFELGAGITLDLTRVYRGTLTVGGGGQAGHFVTRGGATEAEWPQIIVSDRNLETIIVQGVSNAARSSVDIDGLYYLSSLAGLRMENYFDVVRLDRLKAATIYGALQSAGGAYITLAACDPSWTMATTWSELNFVQGIDAGDPGYNVDASGCSGIAAITVDNQGTTQGAGWGSANELDPNGLISWAP